MYSRYCHIYTLLNDSLVSGKTGQVVFEIVGDGYVIEIGVVGIIILCEFAEFLLESFSDIRGEVEVKCRNSLTSVHLVLHRLHRYAGQYACGLDSFGRSALPVSCFQSVLEDKVEWVLQTGKALGRVVVLVVDVDVSILDGLFDIFGQKALVHEGFCRFRCELHHHSGRGICIHVGVFAGDVSSLSLYNLLENLSGLRFSGEVPLISIGDVFLGDFLPRTVHQFHFYLVLNLLHAHLFSLKF